MKCAVLVLTVALGACAKSATAPSAGIPGNYTLTAVNGINLPATLPVYDYNQTIVTTFTSGTLTLSDSASAFTYDYCYQWAGVTYTTRCGNSLATDGGDSGSWGKAADGSLIMNLGWAVWAVGKGSGVTVDTVRTLTGRIDLPMRWPYAGDVPSTGLPLILTFTKQ